MNIPNGEFKNWLSEDKTSAYKAGGGRTHGGGAGRGR